ncbi:MAG: WD40 repeat protein/tRNA A-37 threonylcarbamoyl transferase component Bud32 [Myxococcota bacterium]
MGHALPMRRLPPTIDELTTWDPGGENPVAAAERVQRYEDRGLLGRGGMGDVKRVHDHRLRRDVAMKVLRPDRDSPAARARFAQEAQVTGQLEHPNIVPVHDVGRDVEGLPWFTMKRVDGDGLDEVLERWGREVAAGELAYGVAVLRAVQILRRVCDAIAFAHSRGVVHRDLKPANVMVGAFGEVQVMDWGLARLGGEDGDEGTVSSDHYRALETRDGALAGTPAYMAPEQAAGLNSQIGPATDVWALCTMLYEALTFTRPFRGDVTTILDDARSARFEPPSIRRPDLPVPRELEAVALRGMQAAPDARYPSVAALSADLQAWDEGRPLASLEYTPRQLASMWLRRHRGPVTGAAIATAVAVLVGIGGTVRYVQDLAAAEAESRYALAVGRVATAEALAATGRFAQARTQYRAALPELERLDADRTAARMGLWSTYHHSAPPTWQLDLPEGAIALAGSSHRRFYVHAADRLEERAWPSGRIVRDWPRPLPGRAKGMRLERGKPVLYARGADGWLYRAQGMEAPPERLFEVPPGRLRLPRDPSVVVWITGADDPQSSAWHGDEAGWVEVPLGEGYAEAFDEGRAVLRRYAGNAHLIDMHTGDDLGVLVNNHAYAALRGDMAYLFDQRLDELRAVDLRTGLDRWRLEAKNLTTVTISDDGAVVWASGLEPAVLAVDANTGRLLGRLEGHADRVADLVPLQQGLLSRAGTTWMGWSIPGENPLGQVTQQQAEAMAISPDGRLLALARDGVQVWDLDTGWLLVELDGDEYPAKDLDFVGTEALWVSRREGGATLWRLTDRAPVARIPDPVYALGISADNSLWYGGKSGSITRADADGTPRWTRDLLAGAAWDIVPTERGALVSDFKGNALVVLGHDGTEEHRLEAGRRAYSISRHGDLAATGTWGGKAIVWDWRRGERVRTIDGHDGPVLDVSFSPDGRHLATASFDWKMRIFDTETGERLATDAAHSGAVGAVDWLADGRVVTGAGDDRVLVRDLDLPERLQAGMALASRHAGDDEALSRRQSEQLARYAADRRDWTMAAVAARRAADRLPAIDRARWAALAERYDEAQGWLDDAVKRREAPASYLALVQAALDRAKTAE